MKGVDKGVSKNLTPENFKAIHRRIDQSLPMETSEWRRVEQLLMRVSEFAPTSLVYEIGMAAAVYADDQAQKAYLLGQEDAFKAPVKPVKSVKPIKPVKSVKPVKANKSVA